MPKFGNGVIGQSEKCVTRDQSEIEARLTAIQSEKFQCPPPKMSQDTGTEWDHHAPPEHEDKRTLCQKIMCCSHHENDYESDDDGRGPEDKKAPNPDFRRTTESSGPDGPKQTYAYNANVARVRKTGRWPTDCQCTALFVVFLGFMVAIMVYGYYIGNPARLYLPTDYMGRVCGADNTNAPNGAVLLPNDIDCINYSKNATFAKACDEKTKQYREDFSDQKYLWFMDLTSGLLTYGGVCVSYCPGAGKREQAFCPPELNQTQFSVLNFTVYQYCNYLRHDVNNVTFPTGEVGKVVESSITYKPFLYRCVPTFKYANSSFATGYTGRIQSSINDGYSIFGNLINDVYRSWPVIIIACVLALVFSFTYLAFLRCFAGLVVWVSLILLFLLLGGLCTFCTYYGWTTWHTNEALGIDTVVPKIFFGVGCALGGIAIIYAIVILFLAIRIRKAVGIIQESTKAIGAMPQIVFVPVVAILLVLAYSVLWLSIAGFLWSSGTAEIEGFTVRFRLDLAGNILFYFHIFGFLWITNFIEAATVMIVAGAVGSWYWKRNKKLFDPKAFYVLRSTGRALFYHFGTIAFGSFIVAVVQFIRILFEKFYSELKKAHGDNKVWKGVAWAVRIFLFIFELIIKYINKHAYVQTALYGTHFIKSAINAFTLLTRNFMQIGVLQTMTTISLFIGKLVVSLATCLVGYGLAYSGWLLVTDRTNPISSPLLVACVCFLLAFVIVSVFVQIVDTAIDTVLQCFLVDYEMCYNDPNRKPYCTRTLAIFIQEHRALDKLERFVCQCCCCFTGCCGAGKKGDSDDPQQQIGNAPPTG
jgi:hypothetical protein